VSWFLAAVGFMVLIVLHELGHFTAAKAVGMRVERFSLFFPPLLARKKIGETEYAIGALPFGGYVKISGMNPSEELPDEIRTRAYYSQPVWKRVVVIAAGPAVNLVLGFVLLVMFGSLIGDRGLNATVGDVQRSYPAQGVLHPGDRIVAIDGHAVDIASVGKRVAADACPRRPPVNHCKGVRPLRVTVVRHGARASLMITPVYDAHPEQGPPRMRLGFGFGPPSGPRHTYPLGQSISLSATRFWDLTKATASIPAKVFNSKERKQLHGIVGNYEATRQTILHDPADVVFVMAVISLALALINLFPFLPLDGGHIFWAIVEKIRRRPVSFATMERSGIIGFAVVIMLALIGLTNDVNTLSNGGFKIR
jgi:regulator of sigma E protease